MRRTSGRTSWRTAGYRMSARQIVLDTETTGLNPKLGDRVIELGCVEILSRRISERHFHVYLNPQREVEEGALKVHGLTREFLADKPRFADVARAFLDFIHGAELIIHNADFDVEFLDLELGLAGLGELGQHVAKITDTLAFARELHPGKRNTLDALCERYFVDHSNRTLHGALLDARLLAECYLAMTRGQVALGEQPRVEQRAMQRAVGVIDEIAFAKRVEGVPLAGMQLAREGKRIGDLRHMLAEPAEPGELELQVEELDVEVCVVDDQLGAVNEVQESAGDVGKARLVGEKLARQPVYLERTLLDLALRVQVDVEMPLADAAAEDLHAAELADPVAEPGVQAGGFRIQHDLPSAHPVFPGSPTGPPARSPGGRHGLSPSAIARRARLPARRAAATGRHSSPVSCRRCASRGASSRAPIPRSPSSHTGSRYRTVPGWGA